MTKYTAEQKQAYYKALRGKWMTTKLMADKDHYAKTLYEKMNIEVSYYGFYHVYQQMKALGLKGKPYIDCKTYEGWLKSGFKVIKGEKSKIDGIVWMGFKEEKDEEVNGDVEPLFLLPKVYHLFHKSQVENR